MNPELRRRLERIERDMDRIPSRLASGAETTALRSLMIDRGNDATIGNNLKGIVYNPSPITPTAVYDPNTDTTFPDGLGRGILFVDGVQQAGYVLVLHNFSGAPFPVIAGDLVRIAGTTTLTYDPGSGPVSMTAYLFDYV